MHTDGIRRIVIREIATGWKDANPVMILVLALGISFAAAVFMLIDAIVLRPLPYPDSHQLVFIVGASVPPDGDTIGYWGKARSLVGLAHYSVQDATAVIGGSPEQAVVCVASDQIFDVLRAKPILGRGFEKESAHDYVTVLSHSLFSSRFGGDRRIIGDAVVLGGVPHTVIGVLSPEFAFLGKPDFFVNTHAHQSVPQYGRIARRGTAGAAVSMIGRLREGTRIATARGELMHMLRELNRTQSPKTHVNYGDIVYVGSWKSRLTFGAEPLLKVLSLCASLLLLAACTNFYCMLLTQLAARAGECAIRQCLGAGVFGIFRVVLIQTLMTAVPGSVAGLFGASWMSGAVVAAFGERLPDLGELSIDMRTALFALGLACLISLLTAAASALKVMRQQPWKLLNCGGGGWLSTKAGRRLLGSLVLVQISMSTVLVATGVVAWMRSRDEERVLLGFDPNGVVTARVGLSGMRQDAVERVRALYEQLGRLPIGAGATSAGIADRLPFSGDQPGFVYFSSKNSERGDIYDMTMPMTVGGEYFHAMGIPLLAGRSHDNANGKDIDKGIVVSRSFAAFVWGRSTPVGREVLFDGEPFSRTVIGVVEDVAFDINRDDLRLCYFHASAPYLNRDLPLEPVVIVRGTSTGSTGSMMAHLDKALRSIDPGFSVTRLDRLDRVVMAASRPTRLAAHVAAAESIGVSAIAVIGLYAFFNFFVRERVREIAIRSALGATRPQIMRFVLAEGVVFAILGAICGVLGGFWASRLFPAYVPIAAFSPIPVCVALALLLIITVLGCLLPAMNAARSSPASCMQER